LQQDPPYAIKRDEPDEHGRMEEGFIIDLLDELANILGFKYMIYQQNMAAYGTEQANGTWDGMIGDLIERDAINVSDMFCCLISECPQEA